MILASNHVSFCDSIFLPMVLRRRVTFVAKAEYFDDKKTAWFFGPSVRSRSSETGIGLAARPGVGPGEVLERGELFGIYPEGASHPTAVSKGPSGVLAWRASQAPIVAVAMIGTREAQPIGQAKPNLFMPITIRFRSP